MYTSKDGDQFYVVDGHIQYWDASPANQRNEYGRGFIDCFYQAHLNLSPPDKIWPKEEFLVYPAERMYKDLFDDGYVDVAIMLPTYLTDFFVNGFNITERCAAVKNDHPDKYVLCGSFDPRMGAEGLDLLRQHKEQYDIQGIKLYTAEWRGESKGYKLSDPDTYVFLDECQRLGIRNIHTHKGPTIYPLSADAFDVRDVDEAATLYPDLNFIVEHNGIPRIDDFCWIAQQETNVYAGLGGNLGFAHRRPRYLAEMLAELMYWVGPDKILFGSDYAVLHPGPMVEALVDFQMPAELEDEYQLTVTLEDKRKILGLNAARLYDLPVPTATDAHATPPAAHTRAEAASLAGR